MERIVSKCCDASMNGETCSKCNEIAKAVNHTRCEQCGVFVENEEIDRAAGYCDPICRPCSSYNRGIYETEIYLRQEFNKERY